MAIKSTYCHVREGQVSVITDLEGVLTRLICPDYEPSSGTCRIRAGVLGNGPLSQLLQRVDDDTLDKPAARCALLG